MFDKFTERARLVIVLAKSEAERLKHDRLDTEHLLLGLIKEGGGIAIRRFEDIRVERRSLDVSLAPGTVDGKPSPLPLWCALRIERIDSPPSPLEVVGRLETRLEPYNAGYWAAELVRRGCEADIASGDDGRRHGAVPRGRGHTAPASPDGGQPAHRSVPHRGRGAVAGVDAAVDRRPVQPALSIARR